MKIFDLFFRIKINPLDKLHQYKLEDFLKVKNSFDSDELRGSRLPISLNIKEIVDDIMMDNLHLKIDKLEQLFNEKLSDENEKKLTLDELSDFKSQFTLYKKQNLSPTLSGFKSAVALGLTNTPSSKEIGVCLSAVHTMKGQESEIVFLIGMDDGTFPDFRAINKGEKELQQEKNNAYVAFTRAKRFLYVSYPKKRLMPWGSCSSKIISRFLAPLRLISPS